MLITNGCREGGLLHHVDARFSSADDTVRLHTHSREAITVFPLTALVGLLDDTKAPLVCVPRCPCKYICVLDFTSFTLL